MSRASRAARVPKPLPERRPPGGPPSGSLVLVATPIGNLGDLSPRAVRALGEADVIACEDTRQTRRLLTHAGIKGKRLISLHDHNESAQIQPVLELLHRGRDVAVVSDAGTPGLSDPGSRLASAAASRGAMVTAVPGPSAAVAALVVSGMPAGRFCFEGFLPRKGRQRADRLAALASERRTTILYEAPHRLAATIADLASACCPERRVAIVRELTKVHEEVWRGGLGEAIERTRSEAPRGEFVIVLEGAPEQPPPGDDQLELAVTAQMEAGRPRRDAIASVAAELKVPKRRVYEVAVRMRSQGRERQPKG